MTPAAPSEPTARRTWAPGIASLGLLALVAAALLFGSYLIFSTVRAERAERSQVARTAQVIEALRDIGIAAVNAETGQRGYLLTLDHRYLAPYQLGAATYPRAIRRLHALLDPEASGRQRALLARVEQLTDSKFAEMAETVSLVDDGRILDAKSRVLSDEGQNLMVELRATLRELEAIEGEVLERAAQDTARIESRMLPLLGALVGVILIGLAFALWLAVRTARAEAAAANAAALREARDRADLLSRELNHRVKNLFAVVMAIVKMSGRGEPGAKPLVDKISNRIGALVNAHEVTQGAGGERGADLRALVETAVAPYRSDDHRCTLDGPALTVPAKAAIPLGLVLHELATNAVKYGAWSAAGGTLRVEWARQDGTAQIIWRETLAVPIGPTGREGFGSNLMASSARQLRGTIERKFHPDGVEVAIAFPWR